MNVFEAIKARRSIRSFLDKPIKEEILLKLFEAARQAPSASNRQEWRFVIVKDIKMRKKLATATKGQNFIEEAPVIVACCAVTDNHIMTCGQLCYPIDVAIAIDHISLVAVEMGLGTCWIGAFYEDKVKEILEIPAYVRVVELLAIGYPKKIQDTSKERLPLKEIIFKEKWGNYYLEEKT
ncbi:MAG: nitroreductase family protein [Candidatus Omnitrophica bacterium]|nr:nitroreductase family protein [Candidatus Omnitrophota bacterium]